MVCINMKFNFFTVFLFLLLSAWIVQAVRILFSQKGVTWKTLIHFLGSGCLIVGAVGFFGSALSTTVDFGVSHSFEWPIGNTDAALLCRDGSIVVPHEPSGRIQIYNQSLQFLRGWSINARGGSFQLFPADQSTFYVFTVRGRMKYHYDLHGNIIAAEKYSGSYPEKNSHSIYLSIPTPWYLQPFTHPFASLCSIFFGFLILFYTDRIHK